MNTLSPALQSMAPLPDEALVAKILSGDTGAFELLMRRHNQRLFRIARAIIGDNSEAEDIVQEAYVRAYAGLARFEGRSSVATWLSRIALHESLRRRRRRRRIRAAEHATLESLYTTDDTSHQPGPADRAEIRTMLTAALDSLPPGLRAVVMLRLVEGLSTRETAECLRMSESNVKVSLHRARRMLAEAIQRRTIPRLREEFAFAEERCDRIVAEVFRRLESSAQPRSTGAPFDAHR